MKGLTRLDINLLTKKERLLLLDVAQNEACNIDYIKNAILSGQRNVIVNGILFEGLPILPRETQKNKERFAEKKAIELIKLIEN